MQEPGLAWRARPRKRPHKPPPGGRPDARGRALIGGRGSCLRPATGRWPRGPGGGGAVTFLISSSFIHTAEPRSLPRVHLEPKGVRLGAG